MRPLLFVNWRRVNKRFTALMWIVACVLAMVVLIHVSGATSAGSADARTPPHGGNAHAVAPATKSNP